MRRPPCSAPLPRAASAAAARRSHCSLPQAGCTAAANVLRLSARPPQCRLRAQARVSERSTQPRVTSSGQGRPSPVLYGLKPCAKRRPTGTMPHCVAGEAGWHRCAHSVSRQAQQQGGGHCTCHVGRGGHKRGGSPSACMCRQHGPTADSSMLARRNAPAWGCRQR